MTLHQLRSLTIGVPDPASAAAFYSGFGLDARPAGDGFRLATSDGGEQLRLVPARRRRLLEMVVGADDADDLGRVASALTRLAVPVERDAHEVWAVEPTSGIRVVVRLSPRLTQQPRAATAYNGPGRIDRTTTRADVVTRDGPVVPRKLGHCVLGTPQPAALRRFFVDGIGFRVSDEVRDRAVFLRCSVDHHNLLIQRAPVDFLHHTSWQVDDPDEVGRGAMRMLREDPTRHVWGFGRHCIGSNFFWYLRDPAGNFAEYYSDMDVVVDEALWSPRVWEEDKGLYLWGPPPPPSFLKPDDLAELMVGAHLPD